MRESTALPERSETDTLLSSECGDFENWTLGEWIDYLDQEDNAPEGDPPQEVVQDIREFLDIDSNGDMVFVFPRSLLDTHGGVVKNPFDKIQTIFFRRHYTTRLNTHPDHPGAFVDKETGIDFQHVDSVPAEVYQRVCRRKFVEVLAMSGIMMKSLESDEDGVFLFAWLPLDGKAIKALSRRYRMSVPLKADDDGNLYAETEGKITKYKTRVLNDQGWEVPVYVEYVKELEDYTAPFEKIPAIRLISRRVGEFIDLEQMIDQGILTNHFLKGSHKEAKALVEKTLAFPQVLLPPTFGEADAMRDYCGEKLGMHTLWVSQFLTGIFWIIPLAMISFALSLYVLVSGDHRAHQLKTIVKFLVMACLLWGLLLSTARFRHASIRKSQQWGMLDRNAKYWGLKGSMATRNQKSDIKADLCFHTTTSNKIFRRTFNRVFLVVYLLFAIGLISVSWHITPLMDTEVGAQHSIQMQRGILRCISPAVISFVMIEVWYYIAQYFNHAETYPDNTLWEDAFSTKLFLINIPISLYPALYVAFIKKLFEPKCAENIEALATQIAGNGTVSSDLTVTVNNLLLFHDTSVPGYNGLNVTCMTGCYPTHCLMVEGECYPVGSTCMDLLYDYIGVYMVIFMIWQVLRTLPLFFIKSNVIRELNMKPETMNGWEPQAHSSIVADNPAPEDHPTTYRIPVHRSKSNAVLHALQHGSTKSGPGVGQTKEFIDCLTLFSMITCFGGLVPIFLVCGGLAFLFVYRVRLYTLIGIMKRPYPTGRENLGKYDSFVTVVTVMAIVCNGAGMCFLLEPMRYMSWNIQLFVFLGFEHFLLFIYMGVVFLSSGDPSDVDHIRGYSQKTFNKLTGSANHHPMKSFVREEQSCGDFVEPPDAHTLNRQVRDYYDVGVHKNDSCGVYKDKHATAARRRMKARSPTPDGWALDGAP